MSVIVVEPEYLEVDQLALRIGVAGWLRISLARGRRRCRDADNADGERSDADDGETPMTAAAPGSDW
jgi:hypothetical protein